jgi:hypothetical protein
VKWESAIQEEPSYPSSAPKNQAKLHHQLSLVKITCKKTLKYKAAQNVEAIAVSA